MTLTEMCVGDTRAIFPIFYLALKHSIKIDGDTGTSLVIRLHLNVAKANPGVNPTARVRPNDQGNSKLFNLLVIIVCHANVRL